MRYLPLFIYCCLVASCGPDEPARDSRPSFLFVLADDLAYGDLGSYGNPSARTPRLDTLAAGGLRFTDHYLADTDPAINRAALLTGRRSAIPPADSTFVQRLAQVGYRTAAFGNWPSVDAEQPADPTAAALRFLAEPGAAPFVLLLHYPATASPAAVDAAVGQLVDQLRASQLVDRTLLVCSGGQAPVIDPGSPDRNGPLRGDGTDLYEGSLRVPLIAYWPGYIRAGTESTLLSHASDWAVTVLELGEAAPLTATGGISLVPTLLNSGKQTTHDYLYWTRDTPAGRIQAVRTRDWKYIERDEGERVELYKVLIDDAEEDDIHPLWPRRTKKMRGYATAGRRDL